MDCSCSGSQPSNSKDGSAGAAKFLVGLPSRGLLSSTVVSSNPGMMRVYVCDHDTSPPDGKGIDENQGLRKRTAERHLDGKASKRAMLSTDLQVGSQSCEPDNLHFLTVERLRALLKEKGLPVRGRKDVLISRLRAANG